MRVLKAAFIEFGEFVKQEDRFELSIIYGDYKVQEMTEEELETYQGDWIDLDTYEGQLVFAKYPDEVKL